MKTKERELEESKKKIKELENKIQEEKDKLANLVLQIVPCTSHIYKRDLWNVERCIFCNRIF